MGAFAASLLATAACVSIVAFPAIASAEITGNRLQFAHVYPEGNIWNQTTERFAAAITERTGGKVTVSIAAGGTTGSWEESIEGHCQTKAFNSSFAEGCFAQAVPSSRHSARAASRLRL